MCKKSYLLVYKDFLFHIFTCPHTKQLARTILLTMSFQEHLQRRPHYSKAALSGDGNSPGQLPQSHFRIPGKPPRWPVLWSYVNRQMREPFQTQSGLSQGHLSDQSHRLSTGHTLAKCLDLKMRRVLVNSQHEMPKYQKRGRTKEMCPPKQYSFTQKGKSIINMHPNSPTLILQAKQKAYLNNVPSRYIR